MKRKNFKLLGPVVISRGLQLGNREVLGSNHETENKFSGLDSVDHSLCWVGNRAARKNTVKSLHRTLYWTIICPYSQINNKLQFWGKLSWNSAKDNLRIKIYFHVKFVACRGCKYYSYVHIKNRPISASKPNIHCMLLLICFFFNKLHQ